MFRTATGFLACSWVVGLAWLSPLGGQVADPSTLEELGRRIEELRPRVDEALRRANHVDSVRNDSIREASRIPLDTLFVGPLRIVTHPGQVALAREVFTPLVEEFTPILKGSESLLSAETRPRARSHQYGCWGLSAHLAGPPRERESAGS